ncbi:hypothetical protein F4680DRAFT_464462 [Xylaria scruposa]|nr:hypothetical protein F4680DRAFT_464462 [Xylaria scruposa]
MQGNHELRPSRLLLILVAIAFAISIVQKTRRYFEIHRFKRQHRCLPAARVPQLERIIGLRAFLDLKRDRRERVSLQETTRHAHQYGRTTTGIVLGTQFLSTHDPENVKALLATNLPASASARDSLSLLGRALFTVDDVSTQHSRARLRPAFTRMQVADLDSLEEHVQNLFASLPAADGTAVELQPLFFYLTIDSATDFLLGRSVGTQVSPPGSEPALFSKGFGYAEAVLQRRTELAGLASLVHDSRLNESCHLIHAALEGDVKTGRYNLLAEL